MKLMEQERIRAIVALSKMGPGELADELERIILVTPLIEHSRSVLWEAVKHLRGCSEAHFGERQQ